jgi:hypothetical protein
MKHLMTALFAGIVIAFAEPVIAADALSKDIAARVEAIPIQTLTISDEQFLTDERHSALIATKPRRTPDAVD